MKTLCSLLLTVFAVALHANWDWAFTIGGAGMERAWDIACDQESNIFVAGEFSDTMLVNGVAYPCSGAPDSYVIKYSPSGDVLWVKTFASPNEDIALGVGTDASGNCYTAGYFTGTLSCQGQSVSSYGMWDAYVLKLDSQGNLVWLRSFGGTLNDIGYGLAVNSAGNVYVAGWFADTIKFPGGDGIVSAGGSDVYCCAWDTNGNYLWAKRGGAEGVEYGYEVACDNVGNAYVTGVAGSGSQFGTFTLPSSGMFVCKYNAIGEVQWLAPSVNAGVIAISVQPEASGTQFGMVSGRVTGTGQIGNFPFSTQSGSDDAYWAKFAADTGLWTDMQYYGGAASDKGKDCDCEANTAFLASFEGQAAFGGVNFSSDGESDIILGFGEGSSYQWATAGGENIEIPTCLKLLPNGKIAVTGWHLGQCNFGTHSVDTGQAANQNAFVACYNPSSSSEDCVLPRIPALSLSPNPFGESLSITVNRNVHDARTLDIYNLKGRKVRSLALGDSGLQTHSWDGRDNTGKGCSAGIYLLHYGSESHKVLKLK
jgi:hypothetical protein